MQKIRKILTAVSEKTALPANQPTNNTYLIRPRSKNTNMGTTDSGIVNRNNTK